MKKQNQLTIVIFGATGNLYADKLAKALYILFMQGNLPLDLNIIAFTRKDLDDQTFRTFTKESILKRGKIDESRLDEFLGHISYFKGDFTEGGDFIKLKEFISRSSSVDTQILLHIATISSLYEKIFENISETGLNAVNEHIKILIEKPFGKDEADAKRLQNILSKIFKEDQIFHIDHYLAKETARNVLDFKFNKNQSEKTVEKIKQIKIVFHESNTVGSRGASFDAVGAFRDVGQNHMLQLLALAVMNKPDTFNAENVQNARLKILNDLFIDPKEKTIRAQYEGYLTSAGVDPNSETETFFRVFLRSKNPNLSNIVFELEGGKGLVDMQSEITTTTVALEIYFNDGKEIQKKEFKIQPVAGTMYESYPRVYSDALKGDQTNFPSIEEIIAEWKLTDELLDKWKNIPLVIYNKGAEAKNIK